MVGRVGIEPTTACISKHVFYLVVLKTLLVSPIGDNSTVLIVTLTELPPHYILKKDG
jgi:hypothetical protein